MSHKTPKAPFEIVPGPINLNSYCWKGISAYLLDAVTGHCVVISCPDEEQLKYFWKELTQDKLNMDMTQVTVGDYGSHTKEPIVREKPKTSKFKVPETPDNDDLIWLYHPSSECAFLGIKEDLSDPTNDLSELGPAIQKTAIECRNILLRKLKWRSEVVDKLAIHENIEPTNKGSYGYRLK